MTVKAENTGNFSLDSNGIEYTYGLSITPNTNVMDTPYNREKITLQFFG